MNNGDMPASPVVTADNIHHKGLSKREAFAMAAMQGLVANSHLADVLTSIDSLSDSSAQEVLIRTSVLCADDLLKELEK